MTIGERYAIEKVKDKLIEAKYYVEVQDNKIRVFHKFKFITFVVTNGLISDRIDINNTNEVINYIQYRLMNI